MGFIDDIGKVPTEFLEGLFAKGYLKYVVIAAGLLLAYILLR